jgi:hypothetical protein
VSFFQAYPEIDFSAGPEKKKKSKRLNEFAYIYGSGGYFEPDPDSEEDNYASEDDSYEGIWDSETEIEPETGPVSPKRSLPALPVKKVVKSSEGSGTGGSFEFKSDNTGSRTVEIPDISEKELEKLSGKIDSLEAAIPIYRACFSSGLPKSGDLSEVSDKQLEEAIIRIISCEGPVHAELLQQRIKSHTGIPRMLGKIKQRIFDAADIAENSEKIRVKGEFYWPISEPDCLLRRRDESASAKIEWICDEEIKEAIRFVLNSQYSTPLEDLIVQTSRVLGIKTTRKNTKERIEKLVQVGVENKELALMPNETIYFVE